MSRGAFRSDLPGGISLVLDPAGSHNGYPSSRIQKGITLACAGVDLCEEGVGFGVPVLRTELETIFPSAARLVGSGGDPARVTVAYEMSLVGRVGAPGFRRPGRLLAAANEVFARLHRGYPFLRTTLTTVSAVLTRSLGLSTVFESSRSRGTIICEYTVDVPGAQLGIHMDALGARRDGCVELILMNELGASRFTRYSDSDGLVLNGDEIESWSLVRAQRASLADPGTGISFSADRRPGARLYRGRELDAARLAWAGFAYVLPAMTGRFDYRLGMTRLH